MRFGLFIFLCKNSHWKKSKTNYENRAFDYAYEEKGTYAGNKGNLIRWNAATSRRRLWSSVCASSKGKKKKNILIYRNKDFLDERKRNQIGIRSSVTSQTHIYERRGENKRRRGSEKVIARYKECTIRRLWM